MSAEEDLIAYRLQRAQEAVQEAQILAQSQFWNGAINRLYYSCFYLVDALLLKKKISHKTHGGTKKQFNKLYAQSGIVDEELMKFYNTIFQDRQESDWAAIRYGELIRYQQEDFHRLLPLAERFHVELRKIIQKA